MARRNKWGFKTKEYIFPGTTKWVKLRINATDDVDSMTNEEVGNAKISKPRVQKLVKQDFMLARRAVIRTNFIGTMQ